MIPRLRIRNRTYNIEYEGLNLICFDCGKYGHHRDTWPFQILDKQNLNPEREDYSNNQHSNMENGTGLVTQNKEKEAVFWSWMIAKKIAHSRPSGNYQARRTEEKYAVPQNSDHPGPITQNLPRVSGSRFAIFGIEEDGEEEVGRDAGLEELQEKDSNGKTSSLDGTKETNVMISEDCTQTMCEVISDIPQRETHNIKSRLNGNLLKSKHIVERYVKTTGGDKRKSNILLKASSSGSFKVQKAKKLNTQWEKAKPILITPDLNKPPHFQNYGQHGMGESLLEIRPPDPSKSRESLATMEDVTSY